MKTKRAATMICLTSLQSPQLSQREKPLPRLSQNLLQSGLLGSREARARLFGFSARAYGAPCIGRYDSIVL